MSLYIGKDIISRPILHSTFDTRTEQQMREGVNDGTILHSDLPYIYVLSRHRLYNDRGLTFINSTTQGSIPNVGLGGQSGLVDLPKGIAQGDIPADVRRLIDEGWFYTVKLVEGNLQDRETTLPAHIGMSGSGITSPLLGERRNNPAICINNAYFSYTASRAAYPQGGSFLAPVNIANTELGSGGTYFGAPWPNRDQTLQRSGSGANRSTDIFIPTHDHVMAGNTPFFQVHRHTASTTRFQGNVFADHQNAFPPLTNSGSSIANINYLEITFYNLRLRSGSIEHVPIAKDNNEIRINNQELNIGGRDLTDFEFLQFGAPRQSDDTRYDNVNYYATSVNCDAPTDPEDIEAWHDLLDISYAGASPASSIYSTQVTTGPSGGASTFPNRYFGAAGLGGPSIPVGVQDGLVDGRRFNGVRIQRDAGFPSYGQGSAPRYDTSQSTSEARREDRDGLGLFVNPTVHEFSTVNMQPLGAGLRMEGDQITLGSNTDPDVYSNLFSPSIRPSYVIDELRIIRTPPNEVAPFSLVGTPGVGIQRSSDLVRVARVDANFSRSAEPTLGWLRMDPGRTYADAQINIPLSVTNDVWPDRVDVASSLNHDIPGLFNFEDGQYVPILAWFMGVKLQILGGAESSDSLARLQMYLRRDGQYLEVWYKIWAGARANRDTTGLLPTINDIQIPGVEFRFARLFG